MATESQQPIKRARTMANDSRAYRDPSEELAEVASLVERRRVQNRISQRNYRNKIRSRLEKLEAMVDANKAKDESELNQGAPPAKPTTPAAAPNIDPSLLRDGPPRPSRNQPLHMPSEPEPCRCMTDFLNLPSTELASMCQCPHMQGMMSPLGSPPLDALSPLPSFLDPDNHDPMYISLPTPASMQQGLGTPPMRARSESVNNMSVASSDALHGSLNPDLQSPPRTGLNVHTPPAYQPTFGQYGYPYPIAMGVPMVPMGYFAFPNPAMQDDLSGRPWQGAAGLRPLMHPSSQPMQPCVWVPVGLPVPTVSPQQGAASDSSSAGH